MTMLACERERYHDVPHLSQMGLYMYIHTVLASFKLSTLPFTFETLKFSKKANFVGKIGVFLPRASYVLYDNS